MKFLRCIVEKALLIIMVKYPLQLVVLRGRITTAMLMIVCCVRKELTILAKELCSVRRAQRAPGLWVQGKEILRLVQVNVDYLSKLSSR